MFLYHFHMLNKRRFGEICQKVNVQPAGIEPASSRPQRDILTIKLRLLNLMSNTAEMFYINLNSMFST